MGGYVDASDREGDAALRRLVAAAVSPEAARCGSVHSAVSATPVALRRWGLRPLVAEAVPATGLFSDVLQQARALVFLTDLEEHVSPDPGLVSDVLGLSASEGRLVSRLVSGDNLEKAAADLGITVGTARQEVKSAFAKTGTHRQAELVLLARSLAGRRASPLADGEER